MDQRSTVKVFRDHDEKATIIAYKFLHTKYLTCIYCDQMLFVGLTSFNDLMQFIPIQSTSLAVSLPTLSTLDATLDEWGRQIKCAVLTYLEPAGCICDENTALAL